jgi:3-hydroxyacyl-CoA dehydrogenase
MIEKATAFYSSTGKKPICLFKALPGHVANRLQAALYKKLLYLIQQGVLSLADAYVAVSYGPGPRWGRDAWFVVEAMPERLDLKNDFRRPGRFGRRKMRSWQALVQPLGGVQRKSWLGGHT